MKIYNPAFISSRLCAAVKIGDVTISIEYAKRPGNGGRTRYQYYLDCAENEYESDDLQSGCQGGNLHGGLESLLSFLGAAGEAYGYQMRTGRKSENIDLFPDWVNEWAHRNDDELYSLRIAMEEAGMVLIDEKG